MDAHIDFNNVQVSYDSKIALREVSLEIFRRQIFGIIRPANSGKTTLLKCINRTIDFVPSARVSGEVRVDGVDVLRMHPPAPKRLSFARRCLRGVVPFLS